MSVTKGTGQVGNTFVDVEVKRTWRKKKSQVVAEAVGMWEARGFCELPKAVWEERERAFAFPLFPCWRHFHSSSPLFGRRRLQNELMAIEPRQGKGCKINLPVAIIDGLKSDGFSAERLADENLCALPEEGAIWINPLAFHVAGVFRFCNSIWIDAGRTLVARGRRLLLERLVRAFLVVLLAESIKSPLLRPTVGCRRFSRLRLQRSIHAFVTPVLLPDDLA